MDKKIIAIISIIITYIVYVKFIKSQFNDDLVSTNITDQQPKSFPKINEPVSNFPKLYPPDVPEEIGLAQVYPQGQGVGMNKSDSNSFEPGNPGPLLTDFTIPESYGESSLSDPTGVMGSDQGARILKIKNNGSQMNYKPMDEAENQLYSAAYYSGEVQNGLELVNGSSFINYQDGFNPSDNLKLQSSPGQTTTIANCETMYPNVIKYNNMCITEGDIPYGQVVDNKVNPRLVSRWQSYTGDYNREEALGPLDGTLYPNLSVLASA